MKKKYIKDLQFLLGGFVVVWLIFQVIILRVSPSMSLHMFIKWPLFLSSSITKGDQVSFAFHGNHPKYQSGDTFGKIVYGTAGDKVWIQTTYDKNNIISFVCINECSQPLERVGILKSKTSLGQPLHVGFLGIIPKGYYFVATPHPDSFDSRYQEFGGNTHPLGSLIREDQIKNKLFGLF